MANPKIPQGYKGTYATAADGSATLIMVSRSDSIANGNKTKKEQTKSMANHPSNEQITITDGQQQQRYVPHTTEEKREYAKQFTKGEIASYRKGQQSAYAHMGNIGRRNSLYIHGNLQKDGAATPPPAPATEKPKNNGRNSGNKNK